MTETERIARSLDGLAKSMHEMADAFAQSIEHDRIERVAQEHRLQRGRRTWYVFITVVMAVLLGFTVYYGHTLNGALAETKRSDARILDCSTPGGKCFERKAKTSADTTRQIVNGVHSDTAAQLAALLQLACNASPNSCLPGYVPGGTPPK